MIKKYRAVSGIAAAIMASAVAAPAMSQGIDTQAALNEPAVQAAIAACRADRERFCATVVPGGGRIVRCLSDKSEALSPSCRSAMLVARDVLQKTGATHSR